MRDMHDMPYLPSPSYEPAYESSYDAPYESPYDAPYEAPYDAPYEESHEGTKVYRTGPIFTDPSGQRRRLMAMLGAAGSILLVAALVLAGIGLFGGPDTPFSVFGAPKIADQGKHGAGQPGGQGHHAGGSGSPGAGGSSAPSGSGSPSPSGSAAPSPTGSPSSAPTPTNKAGRTPPGQVRSPRPHPSPTSHGS